MVTACNNPVQEGMAVHTNSPRPAAPDASTWSSFCPSTTASAPPVCAAATASSRRLPTTWAFWSCPLRSSCPRACGRPGPPPSPLPRLQQVHQVHALHQVCDKIQSLSIWDVAGTGSRTTIDVSNNRVIKDSDCALCGQCITHCPTGGLREQDDTQRAFCRPSRPGQNYRGPSGSAVRTAWGEAFGLPREQATMGRMAAALRRLGFRYIFDTNFTADLTIMEGSEFFPRLQRGDMAQYPMFTSCCPGWVRFLKGQYPQLTGQLSTAKSPQQMFGSLTKSWLAQKLGVEPEKIFCVSIMPCVAKKAESELPTMATEHGPDVDLVLTTREFVRMLRADKIIPPSFRRRAWTTPWVYPPAPVSSSAPPAA